MAVSLLLALFAVCLAPVSAFADHPWDIDTGNDSKGTLSDGERGSDKGAALPPTTTSSSTPNVTVAAGWNPVLWFVFDFASEHVYVNHKPERTVKRVFRVYYERKEK